jgi:hypothetical protein
LTKVDIDVPAVIGSDFPHNHKCTLDMGEEVLTLDENQIKCIKESQISSYLKYQLQFHPKLKSYLLAKLKASLIV